MKNFEERRKEYFEKLKKYEGYIIKLIKFCKDDRNKKMIEVLLFPRDEEELNIANAHIMAIQDNIELMANADCGYVEKIDFNNSIFIEYMTTLANLMYNNESIDRVEEVIKPFFNAKSLAQIFYQNNVHNAKPQENIYKIVGDRCKIDITNMSEYLRLLKLINEAMKIVNSYSIDIDFGDKSKINETMAFVKEYHELCVKGIKKNSDPEVNEIINELLGNDADSPKQKFKF